MGSILDQLNENAEKAKEENKILKEKIQDLEGEKTSLEDKISEIIKDETIQ